MRYVSDRATRRVQAGARRPDVHVSANAASVTAPAGADAYGRRHTCSDAAAIADAARDDPRGGPVSREGVGEPADPALYDRFCLDTEENSHGTI